MPHAEKLGQLNSLLLCNHIYTKCHVVCHRSISFFLFTGVTFCFCDRYFLTFDLRLQQMYVIWMYSLIPVGIGVNVQNTIQGMFIFRTQFKIIYFLLFLDNCVSEYRLRLWYRYKTFSIFTTSLCLADFRALLWQKQQHKK